MKSKLRLLLFPVAIAAFVFSVGYSPALQVNAQAKQCYGLSADDCALAESTPAQKPSSFNMAYELTFSGTGPKGNTTDFSVKGSGPFSVDPAQMQSLNSGDVKAASSLMMANTLSWSATENGQTKTGNFEFRIVNGTVYFQGDNATDGKWKSMDLQQAASGRMNQKMPMGMRANPAQALKMMGLIRELAQAPGVISAERTADTTVEGQQIATFVYHIDLQKLISSDQAAVLVKTMAAQNPAIQKMNDAQLKRVLERFGNVFANTQISITHMVGVTDKATHGLGIDVVLNIDPKDMAMMSAMMPRSSDATEAAAPAGPVKANLHFLVTLTGIGNKVTVTAPEGATPVEMPTEAAQ